MGKSRHSIAALRAAVQRGEAKGPERHTGKVGARRKMKTLHDVKRDWETLQETAPVKGIASYKKDWFLDAMEEMIPIGYHESRLDKYRQAVSDQCVKFLPPNEHWNLDRNFASKFATIKALWRDSYYRQKSKRAKEGKKKPMEEDDDPDDMLRGAITEEKGVQLINHLGMSQQHEMIRGVLIAHGGLLRHQELKDADHRNFYVENGKWYLRVIGGKWRKPWEVDDVYIEGADQVLAAIIQLGGSGLVFPTWNEDAIRAEIKACAKTNGWDPSRKWDFHCLRHGKAVDNRLNGMPLEERMKRGRWNSAKTEHNYSRHR